MRPAQSSPRHRGLSQDSRWLALAAVALSMGGCARRIHPEGTPVASLAATRAAQEAFRPLRLRWIAAGVEGRGVLEGPLARFMAQYPRDDLAELASVYRGWISIERGELDTARARI